MLEKIEPNAAIPVAVPTCRKVELMPDAIPDRAGSTTPTAVDASGTLIRPTPAPAIMNPATKWVHDEDAVSPVMSSTPTPVSKKPGVINLLHVEDQVGEKSKDRAVHSEGRD